MDSDRIAISRIEDKLEQCSSGYYITNTGFLDSHEQALANAAVKKAPPDVRTFFCGGYDDAERRILVCMPRDWMADGPVSNIAEVRELLCILRVKVFHPAKPLTHRDYLGALVGLGLDRNVSGDILVRSDGADIIILSSIADFLLKEYCSVGRYDTTVSIVSLDELIIPEQHFEILRDTVPSLRLDNIISTAFKLSRKNAVEAINSGLVSVNHIEATKADAKVEPGSVLVLRRRGKAVLTDAGGESKKNRIWIKIKRYL